jgi:hypothetical protein
MQYKYQTNMSLLTKAELGLTGGQLVTKDNSGTQVVLGNPANSTPVETLTPTYAEDAMDISMASTLGNGFVFLNGTSYDSVGTTVYEFEEADGRVFGLYGRTDGLNQQLFFSGAQNNQQDLQYTTVPYNPPWLSGNAWQASSVCGGDTFGFVISLRNTTPGNTSGPRYVYVRHNGSLLTVSGHQYIELTPMVNSWLGNFTPDVGTIPKIVRVGAYFFIMVSSWQQGKQWYGGWNAQDGSFPLTTAAFPASPPTYNPTAFTISTNNWPGGDYAAQAAPVLFGGQSPAGYSIFRLCNMSTGAVTVPTASNYPEPITAGWVNSSDSMLEGEVDGSGNVFLLTGCHYVIYDAGGNQATGTLLYSVNVSFTAGSPGAYTNAQLNYNSVGAGGTDNLHCQPYPFLSGYGNELTPPQETVASNPAVPLTCVNKLPLAHYWLGVTTKVGVGRTLFMNWFYSGFASVGWQGGGNTIQRAVVPLGNQLGSAAAGQANKLQTLYPMFNVALRADFSAPNGNNYRNGTFQPSGQLSTLFYGTFIGPDLLLCTGYDKNISPIWAVSQMPAGSNITDTSYNRFGTSIPGMGARVAEYPVNLPAPSSTLSTIIDCVVNGSANIRQPLCAMVPTLNSQSYFNAAGNNTMRVGTWTLSGGTYQPPSQTLWTTSASLDAQIAAVMATAKAAVVSAYGDNTAVVSCEIVPVLNSAGTGILFAVGHLITGKNTTQAQFYHFTTPCSVSGGVISLTNTASVTLLTRTIGGAIGPISGVNANADLQCHGRMHIVYTSATDMYLAWTPTSQVFTVGDVVVSLLTAHFNGASLVAASGYTVSQGRAYTICSPQVQGLGIMPFRSGTSTPESDLPISRYTTSAVNVAADFAASFAQAISAPSNVIPADPQSASYNMSEAMTLQAINNNFILQLGAIYGRLNHKEFILPSTFIDMTAQAQGVYYLYLVDTGAGGIAVQYDTVQRAESLTNMYFGTFTRTSVGFSNQKSIAEVMRLGTARLQLGHSIAPISGGNIRTGAYPMATT